MLTPNRFPAKPVLIVSMCVLLCLQQEPTSQVQAGPAIGNATPPASLLLQVPPRPHRPDAGRRITAKASKDSLADWTRRYRAAFPNQPRAFYVNANLVSEILKQVEGASSTAPKGGLRMYFGLDAAGKQHVILVAVKRDGKNVLESRTAAPATASFLVGECADKCPDNCDPTSTLEQ